MDLLNKLAYDSDKQVSMSAILALGLVGAGTNNSRLFQNLKNLATYFNSSPNQLFVVRISQGLLYMGKGMMTLSPLHSNKFLFSNVSVAGLITCLYAATDMETFICGNYHYFLYYLVLSMYPRMCVTLNENLENLKDVHQQQHVNRRQHRHHQLDWREQHRRQRPSEGGRVRPRQLEQRWRAAWALRLKLLRPPPARSPAPIREPTSTSTTRDPSRANHTFNYVEPPSVNLIT